MKKNKFLLGLMIVPCLLASCNKSMSFDQAKNWVKVHYNDTTKTQNTMPIISWEYRNTTGDIAKEKVKIIIDKIAEEAKTELEVDKLDDDIKRSKKSTSGFLNLVDKTVDMPILNYEDFVEKDYSDDKKDNVFKVNDNRLSIQYVKSFADTTDLKDITATKIRLYDDKGFCTDYGVKVNKTLDRNNVIKFKFYFKFLYEHDPIY